MTLRILTIVHVLISLLGIGSGFLVMFGMLNAAPIDSWTPFFLATTIATSVTGFFFPFERLLPSHIFGIISLVVLGLACYGLYGAQLAGAWSWIYVASAVFAQYLNFFVLVIQLFQKVPAFRVYAPTQTETPFKVVQAIALVAFITAGVFAGMSFPG
jgi:hypothetical protein